MCILVNLVLYSSCYKLNFCIMEKQNNILLAFTSVQVTELYDKWKNTYTGTLEDFYNFMVYPSIERERFVACLTIENELIGSFIATNLTV